ncbi:MAG TPA: hypothetical protein VEC06_14500 [Paucimonas sp.]|nr:hypothetical protein [Paucimonas sp.]
MLLFAAGMSGCATLLPDAHQNPETPWRNYADAQAMYARIVPGKTTLSELKALGIDPERTANITVLDHVDLLRRLVPTATFDIGLLDPGLQECMKAPRSCTGYEIEQTHVDRRRVGSFWLDFFNFQRTIDITGWHFDAVFVLKDDKVIYKLWSGKPQIRQRDLETNPLGPLQSIGPSLITR